MTDELDKELDAINRILKALESLEVDEKKRVIEYCLTRLGLKVAGSDGQSSRKRDLPAIPDLTDIPQLPTAATETYDREVTDIRTLKEQKGPKTAIEMAAVVAFYLSELAPDEERKTTITAEDITKYFKQASFKLPGGTNGGAATLRNTKNAGYLEAGAEHGSYKLNPVGYNLVAFGLPKTTGSKPRKPRTKKIVKKSGKKA